MKLYKLKIYPRSSHITPWQSDTIMGSLCWVLKQRKGESILKEFIDAYKEGNYPFVVSDCFPGDYLPKPLAGNVFKQDNQISKQDFLSIAEKGKKAQKTDMIALDKFNIIINNGQTEIEPQKIAKAEAGIMHNQISRFSDTTADGSYYEQQETFWGEPYLSIYAGIDDGYEGLFYALMKWLSLRGFGKRISAGKGAFDIGKLKEFDGIGKVEEPNSVVMLSNYVPARDESVTGQYKAFVKYGKLGQDYSFSDNPFKKPLMMIKPGAVFWTENPKMAYGRVIDNISHAFPAAIQFGCSLACPAKIEKPKTD